MSGRVILVYVAISPGEGIHGKCMALDRRSALACSFPGSSHLCQHSLLSIDGAQTRNINIYNLNTVGAESMIWRDGIFLASYNDDVDVFPDTIAVLRLD